MESMRLREKGHVRSIYQNVLHFYSLRWVAILPNSNSVGLENKTQMPSRHKTFEFNLPSRMWKKLLIRKLLNVHKTYMLF